MRLFTALLLFFFMSAAYGQDTASNHRSKKMALSDTLVIDSVSINSIRFQITDLKGTLVDSTAYRVDFQRALLFPSELLKKQADTITISYVRYPNFLTKDYFVLDEKIIVENTGAIDKLYALDESTAPREYTPFEGLSTSGSISRGVTVGNNQNAVVNSTLDLQIVGKLSEDVSIRASIQDANIPTQEGGYSQNLDEFDQIFMELYSENWSIRAGDVDLQNRQSYFGKFDKKVQGISLGGTLHHENGGKTSAFVAGALVRGIYAESQFTAQEGNQGPYKLIGPNGELYILIVSGSERVYVNGLRLSRGENEDYIIDYNSGELKFNSTYPITANMRITVEYQYTDRNYSRFIGYGGGNYSSDNLDLGVYMYSESDAKNQPLQQSLTEEQVAILQSAGDDNSKMVAPSAAPDTYAENKILYKKELFDGVEIYVFSNNPEDELYNVRFTLLGNNLGNYQIIDSNTVNQIFEYISPVDGIPQGNYEPVIQLAAPTKLQIVGVNGSYHPTEKTDIDFEVAGSKNDLNLFSNLDDGNNDGFAGRVAGNQTLLSNENDLILNGFASLNYVSADFRNVERVYNIEFNRDWNLLNPMGDQSFLTTGFEMYGSKNGGGRYEFQNLEYSENYSGLRHVLTSDMRFGDLKTINNASYLKGSGDSLDSKFVRFNNISVYGFNKSWVGGKIGYEDNQVRNVINDSLSSNSQKYKAFEVFSGIGDSTQIFAEVGYRIQANDSVRAAMLQKVNTSNTYYLKSRLVNSLNAQLSLFANYRILKDEDGEDENEKSLNTRILYNQKLWKGGVSFNTALATNNGVIAQQEFTYVKVEPGDGVFTWIDYNNDGIQDLDEFEIAQFADEAEYIRILLPNQIFLKIREYNFSEIITLNPKTWENSEGFKKFISHFYNQTSYVINRKVKRENGDFDVNPFEDSENDLGLVSNLRNALFFNRGKQQYSGSYNYISTSSDVLLSIGSQKNTLTSHQLNFNHKFWQNWLINLKGTLGSNESNSENFASRNYDIDSYTIAPKLSYLFNSQTRFDVFYGYLNDDNTIGEMEQLSQQKLGFSFAYNNLQKISLNGEFNYIDNNFTGSAFSPVAYQMLEGLQPGTNFTWNILVQKRITKYLDANLSYFGRKSETTSTIHTGSVQLKAFF